MPSFTDLGTTATIVSFYEEDFAFQKNKEEFANKIRSEHLSKVCTTWGADTDATEVRIDSDGDIQLDSDRGTLVITKNSLILTAGGISIGSLPPTVEQFAQVLDEVLALRKPFKSTWSIFRIFVRLRFIDAVALELLASHPFFQSLTTNIQPNAQANQIGKLNWRLLFEEHRFTDSLELEMTPREFESRYARESRPGKFSSISDFVRAASVATVAEKLRPFIEPLILDPSKIRGIPFAKEV